MAKLQYDSMKPKEAKPKAEAEKPAAKAEGEAKPAAEAAKDTGADRRAETHTRQLRERRELHGSHRDAINQMHTRHEEEIAALHAALSADAPAEAAGEPTAASEAEANAAAGNQ